MNKYFRRLLSFALVVCLLATYLPAGSFAAHDSTGRPTDLTGQVYLSVYNGTEFPGEPAEHAVGEYTSFDNVFAASDAGTVFADTASNVLNARILSDVVEGTRSGNWYWMDYVWGVYNAAGNRSYILDSSALKNPVNEQKIIRQVKGLAENADVSGYEIVWYVIKYQTSDSAWHIDGIVKEKDRLSVNYYGNGNTAGTAPDGVTDLLSGASYTIAGNVGNLQKQIGGNTYIFLGWNTMPDGTGVGYAENNQITVTENVTLYAQWYLPNSYTATVATFLDDIATNIEDIHGSEVSLAVSADGVNYIPLEKVSTGVYSTVVNQNGSYRVYHAHDGEYHAVENYQLSIYNQNARVEISHYSVRYDTKGGIWQGSDDPGVQKYFHGNTVYATTAIPYRADANFLGWVDQNGNQIAPDGLVTLAIEEPIVLTARWENSINIQVNITINHGSADGTDNNLATMFNSNFQLLQLSGSVNLPIGNRVYIDEQNHNGFVFNYDEANGVTTYTAVAGTYLFTDMAPGVYNIHTAKSHYSHTVTVRPELDSSGNETGNVIIDIVYNFEPNDFDLDFTIAMDSNVPKELYPQAVNVKVSAWARVDGVLGWHLITQHAGDNPPINIAIDPQTGIGTGIYPVWQNWADIDEPYFYRLEVSAFVLPDGTIVPASSTDSVNYSFEGGLYVGRVDVVGGNVPEFPSDSDTDLPGAYYVNADQVGIPTVTITAHPYTISFNAMGGTVNGVEVLTYENQYRHLDHNHFLPVRDGGYIFDGWYLDEACTIPAHDDHHGHLLTDNVTHYAKWKAPMTIQGTVYVDGLYEDEPVNSTDRVSDTVVILEKLEHGSYNPVNLFNIHFENLGEDVYSGSYIFQNIPDDGSQYRITVMELNYRTVYGNNGDGQFSADENVPIFTNGSASVDVYLSLEPENYTQSVVVDASALAEGFRPQNVEATIIYRDLGDILPYSTIVQHLGGGLAITLTPSGTSYTGTASESVWVYHTNGALYEYQLSVVKVNGTAFDPANANYTLVYDSPSYWNSDKGEQNAALKVTFVPNRYKVSFDLGLNLGEYVTGMDAYLNGDGTYSTTHTWGYDTKIQATPVRPGYYFVGWECVTDGVHFASNTVPADSNQPITLKAVWQKVAGYSYTVYYLDYETGATLHAPVVTENMREGDVVHAASEILGVSGYDFHSASADSITISSNSAANVIVLYYVPETGAGGGMTNPIDDQLHMKKVAVLEDDGTYTIRLEVYATSNPISTYLRQDTPLDIVLVLDQSGSMYNDGYMDDLQLAADEFISMVASHGRGFGIDHRIAIVGFASNESDGPSDSKNPIAGGSNSEWVNTGVFDSNGNFHNYGATGFTYTSIGNQKPTTDGVYYVLIEGTHGTSTAVYNRLLFHEEYYHLLSSSEAADSYAAGEKVYGYVDGVYYSLMLVGSEWTCNGQLYSGNDYYNRYQNVWTHRDEMDHRHIHAFGTGNDYHVDTEHEHTDANVYTRTVTTNSGDSSIYVDALRPVSTGKNGTGPIDPGLIKAIDGIGGSGGTRTQYGMEMANEIFEANPLVDEHENRVRVVVVFTDGQPGRSGFDETEANAAIEQGYVTKNTYGAKVYTVGLYESLGTDDTSNTSVFMNALSSNYPNAKSMDGIVTAAGYDAVPNGTVLDRNKSYYVKSGTKYYELKYGTVRVNWQNRTGWYFSSNSYSNTMVSTEEAPVVTNKKVGSYEVYNYRAAGYTATPNKGFYQTSDNQEELYVMFDNIVIDITTKTSTEIVLHADGIIRDVMGTGFVLTDNTVITATSVPGLYAGENTIIWNEGGAITFAQLDLKNGTHTDEVTLDIPLKEGGSVQKDIYQIAVYNTNPENTISANGPHTVDVSGYDFSTAFISELHPNGYKLVVDITRVEATDDVIWSHPMSTNNSKSGVWAPMDENGYRELLASFEQPSTIFASRNYVIDYGKTITLDGWYYAVGDNAGVVHIDTDISDGMNWFGTANTVYKTRFGVVKVVDGKVTYTPTTTKWNGYDSFYVFGDSGHAAIVTQDANSNGNLWTKVVILPGNNIFYEDTFISGYDDTLGADRIGISFGAGWELEYLGGNPNGNFETSGDVHGWSEEQADDLIYSDGVAHATSQRGATMTFNFTGTGVDIYCRTDNKVGMVVATLKKLNIGANGEESYTTVKTLMIDALSVSGTYYQVPVCAFGPVEYGTYQVLLVATSASAAQTGQARTNFYVDGIRIYNPLGDNLTQASNAIIDTYGKNELNAVFTPIRDILLTNQDFNPELSDEENGQAGAVFVDWIKDPAGDGSQDPTVGTYTYLIGTYEELGPKNEVYLAPGQTIVLKVDPNNNYYVGMKCLAGAGVKAGVSGLSMDEPVEYSITHATDLYYKVTPVDGYIVITNASEEGSGSLLSLTKLRATNAAGLPANGGVITLAPQEALQVMTVFMDHYYAQPTIPQLPPVVEESEADKALREQMDVAFSDIRQWLYGEVVE